MLSKIKILPQLALSLLLLLESCGTVKAHTNRVNELALEVTQSNNIQQTSLFNEAIQVAEGIPHQAQKIKTLSAIAVKLAAAKHTKQSQQLFNQVINLAKQTNKDFGDYEQQMALRDISIDLAEAGQSRRGLELVPTIASNFRKAEALNGIATNLADQGQWQQARQVLLEALQNARGITGEYAYESNGSCSNDKFDVLSKIAGNLSLLGRLESALQVAQSVYGCSSATEESTQDYQKSQMTIMVINL